MFSPIEVFTEIGERAARAANENDQSHYEEERHYLMRLLAFEKIEDKVLAKKAFDAGYKANRIMPGTED